MFSLVSKANRSRSFFDLASCSLLFNIAQRIGIPIHSAIFGLSIAIFSQTSLLSASNGNHSTEFNHFFFSCLLRDETCSAKVKFEIN